MIKYSFNTPGLLSSYEKCHCFPACESIKYDAVFSLLTWPAGNSAMFILLSASFQKHKTANHMNMEDRDYCEFKSLQFQLKTEIKTLSVVFK